MWQYRDRWLCCTGNLPSLPTLDFILAPSCTWEDVKHTSTYTASSMYFPRNRCPGPSFRPGGLPSYLADEPEREGDVVPGSGLRPIGSGSSKVPVSWSMAQKGTGETHTSGRHTHPHSVGWDTTRRGQSRILLSLVLGHEPLLTRSKGQYQRKQVHVSSEVIYCSGVRDKRR